MTDDTMNLQALVGKRHCMTLESVTQLSDDPTVTLSSMAA
jgi:hypothetical protein